MKHPVETPRKPDPIRKERAIRFQELPPDQVPEAADFLGGLAGLEIVPHPAGHSIALAYDLHEHSLEELESVLEDKGFHLESSLLNKLLRALIYYSEETEIHNLDAPRRLLKKSQNEAYINAWEHHPHGDRDDTPSEWREYK
ncbi:hypothetical protein FACS1894158_01200 [Betaproteobacteria bacterium]|nr:hypothetical protein FACS1894158_01200 [Betaproteobacteria bacterium]